MATLKEAIEKVGVGGKVKNTASLVIFTVTGVGNKYASLTEREIESSYSLDKEGWSPVLPKKRVVLQAWECDGEVRFFRKGAIPLDMATDQKRCDDIPNMIFEDGKQVFE